MGDYEDLHARLSALHQLVIDYPGITTQDAIESYCPDGTKMSEASATRVRQALKRLEAIGLVYSRPADQKTRWYSIADPEEPDDDED